MSKVVKHPFTTLTGGKYMYIRPGYVRPTPVDIEVRGGNFFVRFPNSLSPVKLSAIPFDAELTTIE